MATPPRRSRPPGSSEARQPSLFDAPPEHEAGAPNALGSPEAPQSPESPESPESHKSLESLESPESLESQFDALPSAWRAHLRPFIESAAYGPLCRFVDQERAAGKTIYPTDVFRALRLTSPDDVKIVIVGQDPYHGDDHGHPQAHGLAFSVPAPVRPPPSLRNIFKEIAASFGYETPGHGCLDGWAKQGVLLLNTVLTVERGKAASHAKRGWEQCTDTLIRELAHQHENLVFMLWGSHAQAKRTLLDARPHCVLEAPHPSPLSAHRGFLGCRHFTLANEYLLSHGREPIDWRLPDGA